ncbi:RNA cap guanine-N2 methyltransferase (macronuclear) [Tetrahymena thermophila SB210]|uniref:RNA cap guanine-N2 methyltransferase n=1 Tax=Tetrahymena thermophila (strain SB210) TaxID=312017 RepID=Q22BT0_TETTS|nr:RNA cap guanine-N2 methyltransferase [Tetrahymena thermophila SB210]EAR82770.1 RNA cap guanine-N2 methyltransferase [Tetrahymena thermophila SB210]|eukprot:XP_001030433.1 RNA cap guanine-N2 methyltransferase [Tetrahymena thermophila SB210]
MQKTDLFGRENQGQNYDKYRPKYPSKFFELILQNLNSKENYLDVGCGTGQMLFKLNSHFKFAVGTDISEKQVSVANEKIANNQEYSNVKVIQCDANNIISSLEKNSLPLSYDLVTVGQALHWFEVEKFLHLTQSKILKQNQNSRFATAAYYWDGFDIDINDELLSGKQIHESYYNQINDYYDFDRDNLYTNYKYYPFNKYFEQISEDSFVEKDIFQLDDLVRYMKTSSAYNTLVEKNSNNPSFEDPTIKAQNQILEKINAYKKQHNLSEDTPYKILRRTYYFLKVFRRI